MLERGLAHLLQLVSCQNVAPGHETSLVNYVDALVKCDALVLLRILNSLLTTKRGEAGLPCALNTQGRRWRSQLAFVCSFVFVVIVCVSWVWTLNF